MTFPGAKRVERNPISHCKLRCVETKFPAASATQARYENVPPATPVSSVYRVVALPVKGPEIVVTSEPLVQSAGAVAPDRRRIVTLA